MPRSSPAAASGSELPDAHGAVQGSAARSWRELGSRAIVSELLQDSLTHRINSTRVYFLHSCCFMLEHAVVILSVTFPLVGGSRTCLVMPTLGLNEEDMKKMSSAQESIPAFSTLSANPCRVSGLNSMVGFSLFFHQEAEASTSRRWVPLWVLLAHNPVPRRSFPLTVA